MYGGYFDLQLTDRRLDFVLLGRVFGSGLVKIAKLGVDFINVCLVKLNGGVLSYGSVKSAKLSFDCIKVCLVLDGRMGALALRRAV